MAALSAGFILLDASVGLIAFNQDALQILAFPTLPENIARADSFVQDKVRASLLSRLHPGLPPDFEMDFRSGERRYSCTAYFLERRTGAGLQPGVVLLLERESQPFVDVPHAAAQFDLTPREQETVEHLLRGLTTKEIAQRMKISPSTVNAFLRLVMVKVGVNNRSAVVHKVLRPHSFPRHSARSTTS